MPSPPSTPDTDLDPPHFVSIPRSLGQMRFFKLDPADIDTSTDKQVTHRLCTRFRQRLIDLGIAAGVVKARYHHPRLGRSAQVFNHGRKGLEGVGRQLGQAEREVQPGLR